MLTVCWPLGGSRNKLWIQHVHIIILFKWRRIVESNHCFGKGSNLNSAKSIQSAGNNMTTVTPAKEIISFWWQEYSEQTKWTCIAIIEYSLHAHVFPVMCPLAEMSGGWGAESMSLSLSLSLCQPVRNPTQGNFWMSLCFGRLSSSSSPVILWSCQASSLSHSLSTLMGLMSPPPPSGSPVRWQKVKKQPLLVWFRNQ